MLTGLMEIKIMTKLEVLADFEGYSDVMNMLEENVADSICPGICINRDCEYTVGVEPDCYDGYCEECGTQTVRSALALAGII